MGFYVWEYLGFVRAMKTGFAEFKAVGRKKFGGEFPKCPECETRIGTLNWQPPFVVQLTTNKFGDLCTDGQDILLSDRFREAWVNSGLTGLRFERVNVEVAITERSTPIYFVARIAHTITRLDEKASGVVASNVVGCDSCRVMAREKVERIRLDRHTIPELDIFRPSGLYGATLVTSRFVEFVNELSLKNFHFKHQDDYREPKVFEEQPSSPRN
ncbi:double-CXXCG motif protein [Rhodopirellula sp. MGV]|uniref:double-CXXCG motif protein n=1 Tax=Rhodopirellula sp. MGV TaxID=2023130 RepID=UPI000B96BB69|nr:double-CXXCG motif protein [Rhodopirellula sp. MGV]OYP38914.1 hypothetical protein CGZ80_01460 [Rhodopirellula sp. MGV]PNY37592.1 hypothetical protein C2E31_06425 [Rhodopirellula baltica]